MPRERDRVRDHRRRARAGRPLRAARLVPAGRRHAGLGCAGLGLRRREHGARGSVSQFGGLAGNTIENRAPPSVGASSSVPPKLITYSRDRASPRPVPLPIGLLVTNGSNRRALTSAGIPGPLSCTAISTESPVRSAATSTHGLAVRASC